MIQHRFGMPIDTAERPRCAASAPACAAVVAARLNAPEQAEALLRALRVRIMGGELPDEPATVAGAAQDAGLTRSRCRRGRSPATRPPRSPPTAPPRAIRSPPPACSTTSSAARPRSGATPARATIAVTEATARRSPPGYQPIEAYEVLLANVAPGLQRRDEPSGVAEVLAWAGTPLATAEVALLCGMDRDEAREALVEAGAVERPVGPDAYWSL